MESVRSELLQLQQSCRCTRESGGEEEGSRKRQHDALQDKEETGRPAKKRGEWRRRWTDGGLFFKTFSLIFSSVFSVVLEEEIWRLHEENDKKEETIQQLMERTRGLEEELRRRDEEVEEERSRLEEDLRRRKEEVEELKKEQVLLEQKVQNLTGRS